MKHRLFKGRRPFLRERCRGKRVLDVGCIEHTLEKTSHPDWLHAHLKSTAKELVGVDYEAEIAEELNKRGYNVIVANAQDFDIRDKYPEGFDVVVAGEIIEHLTNPGLFMDCLAKHLAPGGEIILTTPNAYAFLSFLETLILGHEQINDDHTLVFSRKMMHEFMKKAGYEVKEWYFTDYIYRYHESRFMRFLVWPMAFVQAIASIFRKEFCRTMVYVVQPKQK
ncbi:MAG: methyltransferase domain-containing protein [Kiritimatiellae bacterium]|nr:methyltransferase domain-containing protein [Kiritimatiellia bacterium]